MKQVKRVYQLVFVMVDGAELAWKIFSKVEHYDAYVEGLNEEHLRRLGIVSIRYRMHFIDDF